MNTSHSANVVLSELEQYQLAAKYSRDMISTHTWDDWIHTSVNPAVTEVLGYSKEEMLGLSTFDFWHPDDVELCLKNCDQRGPVQANMPMRFRMRHKNGHYIYVECARRAIRDKQSGEIQGLLCVTRDVSQQVRTEQLNQRLVKVVESSSDLILFFSPDYKLSYANRSAMHYFDIADCGEVGMLYDLLPGMDRQAFRRAVDVARAEGHWKGQIGFSWFDGYQQVLIHELIFHDHIDGNYFSMIARDVSEQRRAEAEVMGHRKKLLKFQRLMSASELGASIAHELNQPIAAIINFCHGALTRLNKKDAQKEQVSEQALQAISTQAERAANVIRRVRSLVNKTSYQDVNFNLGEVCQNLMQVLNPELEQRNIELFEDYAAQAWVRADKVQIEQLLTNLVINAGESLEESTQKVKNLSISVLEDGDSWRLSVIDNCRAPLPNTEQVFEAYYSSKDQGLGIGLSMCKSIAEANSGQVWMESRADGLPGAALYLTLPKQAVPSQQKQILQEEKV
ncbi:PAS domain S-box protein [uncultured Pseudoteredinibacter sp.]|uniref:PAS domain-containing sensor histidine kinase n=1 Tax=uncultured Pseudoteredinibacter sp. TaxID=1641701 RepID=UPI0026374C1D|nr:PAS domain S-box protein [uncultured Pseudoteredinibacter sp.]